MFHIIVTITPQDWSEIVQLLHAKLSDSKQNVDELESALKKLEAKLQRSQVNFKNDL